MRIISWRGQVGVIKKYGNDRYGSVLVKFLPDKMKGQFWVLLKECQKDIEISSLQKFKCFFL